MERHMTRPQRLPLAPSQFGGLFKLPALPLLSLLLLKKKWIKPPLQRDVRSFRSGTKNFGITNFFEASMMGGSGKAIT